MFFGIQPTKITRRSPSPSIISPSLPPRVRRVSADRVPWMDNGSGKHNYFHVIITRLVQLTIVHELELNMARTLLKGEIVLVSTMMRSVTESSRD